MNKRDLLGNSRKSQAHANHEKVAKQLRVQLEDFKETAEDATCGNSVWTN